MKSKFAVSVLVCVCVCIKCAYDVLSQAIHTVWQALSSIILAFVDG